MNGESPVFVVQVALIAQAAATLFMTGLIWFVQVVHYPLFALVGSERFARYEAAHQTRTTLVVGPPMLVEAAAAAFLAWWLPTWLTIGGLSLLALIWMSTALLQVPRHGVLARRFETRAHATLVATNWIRTFLWTARALLALAMLVTWRG